MSQETKSVVQKKKKIVAIAVIAVIFVALVIGIVFTDPLYTNPEDISEVMRLYVETHKSPTETDIVTLKSHGSEVSLACDSIVYVEGVRDYQYIHISDGEPVRLRESMSALLLQLEPLGFIRIHKGYIVNFKYIRRIDATSVTLTDGTELPLSRRSVEPVRAKYMQLCRSYGFVRLN